MKKIVIVAVMAIAVGLFSGCGNSNKKSDTGTQKDEDSLAYAMGIMESQQMKMALSQLGVDSAYIDEFIKGVKAGIKNSGDKKKDAYNKGLAIGISENMRFKQMVYPQLFANDSTKTLPMDKFMEGFRDGMKGKLTKMNPEKAQMVFQTAGTKIQQRYFEKAYGASKKANDAFMAKIARQPGVKSLGNGVYYKEIKAGNGKTPTAQDMTKVSYNGKTIDGKTFDKRDNVEMPVSGMIQGWTEALTHMKEGATWEVYIPYNAAYGAQDKGQIKPFSALHFTITLVSVEKAPQGQQGAPQQMPVKVK